MSNSLSERQMAIESQGSHLVYYLGTHERTTHIFEGAM